MAKWLEGFEHIICTNQSHGNHCVYGVIYLDKQFIKLYNSLDASNLKKKCNYTTTMILISLYVLGYHGYNKNQQTHPHISWSIFVIYGVSKQANVQELF